MPALRDSNAIVPQPKSKPKPKPEPKPGRKVQKKAANAVKAGYKACKLRKALRQHVVTVCRPAHKPAMAEWPCGKEI